MTMIAEITAKHHDGVAPVGFETGRSAHYEGLAAGAADHVRAVRWALATNILWAWILTLPAAALVGGIFMGLIYVIAGHF